MGLNVGNSLNDPISPTYGAGTLSLTTGKGSSKNEFNDDCARPGQPNGYFNSFSSYTVGSFNSDWTNYDLTQSVQPTYSSGLLSFGRTGLQS